MHAILHLVGEMFIITWAFTLPINPVSGRLLNSNLTHYDSLKLYFYKVEEFVSKWQMPKILQKLNCYSKWNRHINCDVLHFIFFLQVESKEFMVIYLQVPHPQSHNPCKLYLEKEKKGEGESPIPKLIFFSMPGIPLFNTSLS